MTETSNIPFGHEVIQAYLKTIDGSPGVYRMLNAKGEVLYVGKARNLRARVSNYARPSGHSLRIARMIFETTSMMFLTTRTETEALLLEQNLIKQLKPRYNVLLRDDKSFPNILISKDHAFPQLKKHRGKNKDHSGVNRGIRHQHNHPSALSRIRMQQTMQPRFECERLFRSLVVGL